MINIECPSCKIIKSISVEKFKSRKHTIKIKCQCDHVFSIDIEFRRYYRKKTNLIGSYIKESSVIDINSELIDRYIACTIVNLSLHGLAFKVINDSTIKKDDIILINFMLDDINRTNIEKSMIVRHVDNTNGIVGAEFIETNFINDDKRIYFYLK